MPRVRVYIACSLDGFIASEDDDLSWLPHDPGEGGDGLQFLPFLEEVGCLLMGRRTWDVVASFDDESWHYGDRPILVPTHRPLHVDRATVRAVSGDIHALVAAAREAAGDKDVYLDGGGLVRDALDAGVVDELIITLIPTALGRGVPLFAGAAQRHAFELTDVRRLGDQLVQLFLRPRRAQGVPV